MNVHKAWLGKFTDCLPENISSAYEAAEAELKYACPDTVVNLAVDKAMNESFSISGDKKNCTITGGETGILYGAYRFIEMLKTGAEFRELHEAPKYPLRMINCWDNMDGSIERGYSGNSLFFNGGDIVYDRDRIIMLGRLLASVGINVLCINNVNVHYPAQLLIEDKLSDVAELAGILRPFGVRLMLSIDFSQPMRHGIDTADPLDENVRIWWKTRVKEVYRFIPDLAGFLVKADSENRPGPFTYGRNHAEGANMIAEALAPYGGVLVWRCFVYNCRQDWRDTETDRPRAAYDHYAYLDGKFAENVILQVKHGPFDFQVREPVSPLLLGMKETNLALELQLAQEYTGHQIDIYTMAPMWREIFNDIGNDRIMSVAAVSNLGNDFVVTGHPFAAVNLFGYGRFAWNPDSDPEAVIREWCSLTYDLNSEEQHELIDILMNSRKTYEKYTAPLGICWMVRPHDHYGPSPDGYEYDLWGTYHKADRNAIGIDRTVSGTGYLDQYPTDFRERYATPEACPDLLKLFFHRLPYTYVMSDGRTLVQRIYDDHFEGYAETKQMESRLADIHFPEPDRRIISQRIRMQIDNAREWCDVINTFFHRLSGIDDIRGRQIYN